MEDPQHKGGWTPGPWKAAAKPSSVVGWPVVAQPMGRMICDVAYLEKVSATAAEFNAFYEECEANARLIAAAPDLYEAADAVMPILSLIEDGLWDDCPYPDVQKRRIAALRAALAKAKASPDKSGGA